MTTTTPKETTEKVAKPKQRNRTSIACVSCRIKRTKCIRDEGQTDQAACEQCRPSGSKCVIRDDDERKRPTSKAYMNSLTERIELLEGILEQSGQETPPPNYPPRYKRPSDAQKDMRDVRRKKSTDSNTIILQGPPAATVSDHSDGASQSNDRLREDTQSSPRRSQRSSLSPAVSDEFSTLKLVDRLLSTTGHLSYDKINGRLQYFGPTSNLHIYSHLSPAATVADVWEQDKRTEKMIQDLSPETYDYLMDLYWTYYNSVLPVVHKKAFNEHRDNGRTKMYSSFLHICVLAMGFRFADLDKPDIKSLSLGNRESKLHKEAKYLFEHELEKPGDIPSVQALLILGDLECGVGRDNTGWLYSGMACRLVFDLGLNLECDGLEISEQEIEIRHTVLRTCAVYDKYWALFLGRPTSIKNSDLGIAQLTDDFATLITSRKSGSDKTVETKIYESLLGLMEVVGRIIETVDAQHGQLQTDASTYLAVAALDQELNAWYRRLPAQLRWTPANMQIAPISFFVLHQQFHSALILLHRPVAQYQSVVPNASTRESGAGEQQRTQSHFSVLSRTVCFDNAVRVARVFQHYRQRFDVRKIFITGMQHAGIAATALIAAIALTKDPEERPQLLRHLLTLAEVLKAMSSTYQPCERMSHVIDRVLQESGWEELVHQSSSLLLDSSTRHPIIPSRRTSSNPEPFSNPKKRLINPATEPQMQLAFGDPFAPSVSNMSQPLPQTHNLSSSLSAMSSATMTADQPSPSMAADPDPPDSMSWDDPSALGDTVLVTDDALMMDFLQSPRGGEHTAHGLDVFGDIDVADLESLTATEKQGRLDVWGDLLRQMGWQ